MTENITTEIVRTMILQTEAGKIDWVNINPLRHGDQYSSNTPDEETRIVQTENRIDLASLNREGQMVIETDSEHTPETKELMAQVSINVRSRVGMQLRMLEALGVDTSNRDIEHEAMGEVSEALTRATKEGFIQWETTGSLAGLKHHRTVVARTDLRLFTDRKDRTTLVAMKERKWSGEVESRSDHRVWKLLEAVEGARDGDGATTDATTEERPDAGSETLQVLQVRFLKALQTLG